jgi:hypothetical protein
VSNGAELRRQEAVAYLRNVAYGGPADFRQVQCAVANLRSFYAARSGRQQTFLDLGTTGVTLGGVGRLAAEGAGSLSQQGWGYFALAPVLLSEIAANTPTRNLYYAGGLALDLVTARYASLMDAEPRVEGERVAWALACENLDRISNEDDSWKKVDLADYVADDFKQLSGACQSFRRGHEEALAFAGDRKDWGRRLVRLYAADVSLIEASITNRDHQLRQSPLQTLKSLAAAPFNAVGSLISGQDGREAVNAIQTTASFKALDASLSEIEAPPAWPSIEVAALSRATLAHAGARRAPDEPTRRIQEVARTLRDSSRMLTRERQRLQHASASRARMVAAARANQLRFNYDSTRENASVVLEAPKSSPGVTPTAAAGG